MRDCTVERGCAGKMNLGRKYVPQVTRLSIRHKKSYGVYRCPHCNGTHLTTQLHKSDLYPPLLMVVEYTSPNPE